MENIQNIKNSGGYLTPYVLGLFDIGPNIPIVDIYIKKTLKLSPSIQKILHDFSTAEFIYSKLAFTFNLVENQSEDVTRTISSILLSNVFIGDMPKEIFFC